MIRRIFITGANRGIGLAIALRCLQDYNDTHVILACRSSVRGNEALQKIKGFNSAFEDRVSFLECDVASSESVSLAAQTLKDILPKNEKLYGIVNNAGIALGTTQDILNINVRGPKRVDDAFIPMLDPKNGRIVQMSSGAASGCVEKASEDDKEFFVDPDVTWDKIEAFMGNVESRVSAGEEKDWVGYGAYELSKALLNSLYLCHCFSG